MATRRFAAGLAVGLALLAFAAGAARAADDRAAAADADAIARLIEQLADGDYVVRERASEQLGQLGGGAVPAIVAAARSENPEVATRAFAVLKQMHEREEAAAGTALEELAAGGDEELQRLAQAALDPPAPDPQVLLREVSDIRTAMSRAKAAGDDATWQALNEDYQAIYKQYRQAREQQMAKMRQQREEQLARQQALAEQRAEQPDAAEQARQNPVAPAEELENTLKLHRMMIETITAKLGQAKKAGDEKTAAALRDSLEQLNDQFADLMQKAEKLKQEEMEKRDAEDGDRDHGAAGGGR